MFIASASFTRYITIKNFPLQNSRTIKDAKISTFQSLKYYMQSIAFGRDILLFTDSRNKLQ
jgi:hypothetical protein